MKFSFDPVPRYRVEASGAQRRAVGVRTAGREELVLCYRALDLTAVGVVPRIVRVDRSFVRIPKFDGVEIFRERQRGRWVVVPERMGESDDPTRVSEERSAPFEAGNVPCDVAGAAVTDQIVEDVLYVEIEIGMVGDRTSDMWPAEPGSWFHVEIDIEAVFDALDDRAASLDAIALDTRALRLEVGDRIEPVAEQIHALPCGRTLDTIGSGSDFDAEFDPVDHGHAVDFRHRVGQVGMWSIVVGYGHDVEIRAAGCRWEFSEAKLPVRVRRVDV